MNTKGIFTERRIALQIGEIFNFSTFGKKKKKRKLVVEVSKFSIWKLK